jgi:hypothetical protein
MVTVKTGFHYVRFARAGDADTIEHVRAVKADFRSRRFARAGGANITQHSL